MPRPKKNDQLLELAKRGAQARLNDLVHEVKLLIGLFPHLRHNVDKDELPISFLLKRGARGAQQALAESVSGAAAAPVKRTRNLSAAARRAISNAQKKRWALHRANAAKNAAKKP